MLKRLLGLLSDGFAPNLESGPLFLRGVRAKLPVHGLNVETKQAA
jgi:hypothetical protein